MHNMADNGGSISVIVSKTQTRQTRQDSDHCCLQEEEQWGVLSGFISKSPFYSQILSCQLFLVRFICNRSLIRVWVSHVILLSLIRKQHNKIWYHNALCSTRPDGCGNSSVDVTPLILPSYHDCIINITKNLIRRG